MHESLCRPSLTNFMLLNPPLFGAKEDAYPPNHLDTSGAPHSDGAQGAKHKSRDLTSGYMMQPITSLDIVCTQGTRNSPEIASDSKLQGNAGSTGYVYREGGGEVGREGGHGGRIEEMGRAESRAQEREGVSDLVNDDLHAVRVLPLYLFRLIHLTLRVASFGFTIHFYDTFYFMIHFHFMLVLPVSHLFLIFTFLVHTHIHPGKAHL